MSEYLLKRFLSERNSSPEAWKSHSTFQPGNTSIMDPLRDRDRNLEATNPVLSACRNLAAAWASALVLGWDVLQVTYMQRQLQHVDRSLLSLSFEARDSRSFYSTGRILTVQTWSMRTINNEWLISENAVFVQELYWTTWSYYAAFAQTKTHGTKSPSSVLQQVLTRTKTAERERERERDVRATRSAQGLFWCQVI